MNSRFALLPLVVLVAVLCLFAAAPAGAQISGPGGETAAGTATSTTNSSVSPVVFTGATSNSAGADVSTITTQSSRTIVEMNSLNLSGEDTLNVVFGANTDILILKVNSGAATISGTLNGFLATVGGSHGGQIWIVSNGGVVYSSTAVATAGGWLTSTGAISNLSFFGFSGPPDNDFTFSGAANSVQMHVGARMTSVNGGAGFVAPLVTQAGTVWTSGPTFYGSAEAADASYNSDLTQLGRLTLTQGTSNDVGLDLLHATGGAVYAASRAEAAGKGAILATGIDAQGFPASGLGDVVISAGGDLERPGGGSLRPVPHAIAGAGERNVRLGTSGGDPTVDDVQAIGDVRVRGAKISVDDDVTTPFASIFLDAIGNLELLGGAELTASSAVALSTGSQFINNAGAAPISAAQWGVYAPSPSGQTYGGLNSNNTALWNASLATRPPSSFTGNRYVFGHAPKLTFTSLDDEKDYGVDVTGALTPPSVSGFQSGVSGAFLGDTASTAYAGSPALTSPGAPANAMVGGSPYSIDVAQGTLTSNAGYGFDFASTGELTVNRCAVDGENGCDRADPTVTITQPGANSAGWHNSTATAHVVADGGPSGIFSLSCTVDGSAAALTNVSSQPPTEQTSVEADVEVPSEGRHPLVCSAEDGGGNTAGGNATVNVDKTAPNAPTIGAGRDADYTSGGVDWYKAPVTFSFASAGDPALADSSTGSGVVASSIPAAVSRSTTGSLTASGTVTDVAGNISAAASRTAEVDADPPTFSVTCPSTAYLNGTANVTVENASDVGSGLVSDPSSSAAVDTSSPGVRTVTTTATDNVGNTTSETCTTKVVYKFGGFRQPINTDGSSVFKLGSTIPVKFSLTDANGVPVTNAAATLQVAKLTGAIEGTFFEATSTAAASSGSQFRYDPIAQQYVFNLGTKGMSSGTWALKALLDDTTTPSVHISLR